MVVKITKEDKFQAKEQEQLEKQVEETQSVLEITEKGVSNGS